jgi:hypothetical protein
MAAAEGDCFVSFIENESHMHRQAKRLVADWLRSMTEPDAACRMPPIWSRPNRSGPMRGVYVEYPIGLEGQGIAPVWDESPLAPEEGGEFCPTFGDLKRWGVAVACVCDIAILHKGMVAQVVEIVHKHPTPDWKRNFLHNRDVEVIEVSAAAVMHMCGRPDALPLYQPGVARK